MVAKHRCGFNAVAAPPVVAFSPHQHARALSNAPIEVDHLGVEHADAARRHRLPDCVRLVGSVDAEQSVRVTAWPPRRFVIIIVLRWAAIAPALLVAAIVARRWIGRIGRVIIILRDGGMASRHEHANRETDKRGSVSAFVTHASPNGVMEALTAGKPMVAAPLFGDQCYFAPRVEGLGVGVRIDKTQMTPATISSTVRRVVKAPSYADAALAARAALRRLDGLGEATRCIEAALTTNGQGLAAAMARR